MNHLVAVDDGLASGNLNAADICFLIALILGGLAVLVGVVNQPPLARWTSVLLSAAVALVALGLLLL